MIHLQTRSVYDGGLVALAGVACDWDVSEVRRGTVKLACHSRREAGRGRVAALQACAQATTGVPVTACQVWKRAVLVSR